MVPFISYLENHQVDTVTTWAQLFSLKNKLQLLFRKEASYANSDIISLSFTLILSSDRD